jgi:hypothetical protein
MCVDPVLEMSGEDSTQAPRCVSQMTRRRPAVRPFDRAHADAAFEKTGKAVPCAIGR